MKNDIYPHMQAAAAEASRIARGVDPTLPMTTPTHCPEWDLGALLNHWILYSSHGLEHRALRKQLPEDLTKRDFAAEPGWAGAYAAQLDRAVAAWADPAAWEGEVDTGFAKMDASVIAALVVKELAVHGWDVARVTGQELRLPEATGEFILGVVAEHAEIYRQYDGFAEPVPVADDAPALERALALSGRDPRGR
ncbi:TIGR03086 family protein [Streptomyces sp. A7024]|uniref:TIGR03086 family protein n=1 Tax=Streptomyces coryli TaxID=1128680 RepID=A0A6G4TUL5_9ACTN|nr:TIGR03086 family metal-binding protein [Streptomyces coryli]NGN63709.1 TIGR03086 family protein [Streptomyces coryli]